MSDLLISHEQATGEVCEACDCELVLVVTAGEAELRLECDCGAVICGGAPEAARRLSPAA